MRKNIVHGKNDKGKKIKGKKSLDKRFKIGYFYKVKFILVSIPFV